MLASKPNHEMAAKDYILGMSYADIAAKYAVSINTVKSWKKRHGWERDKTARKKVAKGAPVAHQKTKKGAPSKKDAPEEPEEELSDKEQLFCYHYVRTWNATQAALQSGYTQNKASAQVLGSRLMQRPRVKLEIDRLRELFRQDIHVDIQDLLAFCMKVIGADIGDYIRFGSVERIVYDDDGPVRDEDGEIVKEPVTCITLGESDQLDTSVIQEVKQGKDGISFKLADKKWAWDQVTKYFDLLPDKWQREISGKKLEIERRKVEVAEKNAEKDSKPLGEAPTFVDDIGSDDEDGED